MLVMQMFMKRWLLLNDARHRGLASEELSVIWKTVLERTHVSRLPRQLEQIVPACEYNLQHV